MPNWTPEAEASADRRMAEWEALHPELVDKPVKFFFKIGNIYLFKEVVSADRPAFCQSCGRELPPLVLQYPIAPIRADPIVDIEDANRKSAFARADKRIERREAGWSEEMIQMQDAVEEAESREPISIGQVLCPEGLPEHGRSADGKPFTLVTPVKRTCDSCVDTDTQSQQRAERDKRERDREAAQSAHFAALKARAERRIEGERALKQAREQRDI